jgi:hypothetical protein
VDPVRISRSLLSSPSLGRLLLPQDLLVFIGPLFLGFVLHLDFFLVLIFFALSFGLILHLRGYGEGTLRGMTFFFFSGKAHLPALPDPFRSVILKSSKAILGREEGVTERQDPLAEISSK